MVPVPDPSTLTRVEVNAAKEDLRREMRSDREYILGEIRRVNDVTDQKFDSVDQRFLERDARTATAAQENRISLDAALSAAKEAVSEQNKANAQAIAKSELATQKQIDSQGTLMSSSFGAMNDKIADLKTRLDTGAGGHQALAAGWGYLIGAISAVALVIAVVIAVVKG